ncbi:hypothetical protein J4234_03060 [Candidatus Woesearchaeota archaeon]|nr:hypothetical protein [Candidatus Woesearchaeota archaeon]
MSDDIVIKHHILSGSNAVPTATLDIVVNGDTRQVASAGQSHLDALHRALFKAFGYEVESWITVTLPDHNKVLLNELTLVIFGNGNRYVAVNQFLEDPESSGLYNATIVAYLKALREQKI